MPEIYDLFVSGGRDSVAAALVAAEKVGVHSCRVVFINEFFDVNWDELGVPSPLEYVRKFAQWLGAPLIVLRPSISFWDGVKRWGYPHVFHKRWCFYKLKKEPLMKFREQEAEEGLDPVWVVGIRRGESRRRSKLFRTEYTRWKVGRHYTRYWFPILNCSERDVRDIIKQHNPPTNPLWKYGFSFECLCMAGMSRRKLDELIVRFPKLALYLAEKDKEVQRYMRRGASYPTPLLDVKVPLHVYVRRKLRENLMIWMK